MYYTRFWEAKTDITAVQFSFIKMNDVRRKDSEISLIPAQENRNQSRTIVCPVEYLINLNC
jgi:hypothetical protein